MSLEYIIDNMTMCLHTRFSVGVGCYLFSGPDGFARSLEYIKVDVGCYLSSGPCSNVTEHVIDSMWSMNCLIIVLFVNVICYIGCHSIR